MTIRQAGVLLWLALAILLQTFAAMGTVSDPLQMLAGRAGSWLSRGRIRRGEVASGIFLTAGGACTALCGR